MSWFSFGGGSSGTPSVEEAPAETDSDRVLRVLEFAKNLASTSGGAQTESPDGSTTADDCMEIRREMVCAARHQNQLVQGDTAIQFDDELDDRVPNKFGRVWLRVTRVRPRDPPELPANLAGSGIAICTDPHSLPRNVTGLPSELASAADAYLGACERWAARELARLSAANVYNELFEVHQRMQQPDSEVDLVWGLGWATWAPAGKLVDHPIIEVPVEIELDRHDGALLVRPRAYCDATLALAPFEHLGGDAARLMNLEKVREALHEQQEHNDKPDNYPITPSKSETYEKVLRAAATHISSSGHFVSAGTKSSDRPNPTERLCVADTWAIFSRARSSNAIVRDIQGLINHVRMLQQSPSVGTQSRLPESALRFVRFGKESPPTGEGPAASMAAATEQPPVLFPLHYNEAQEQIVRLLERPDTVGVVVSGPPGTGKTHTIANIICHCLAKGQRVLVTSKGEQPLRVLQHKLPRDIRELTISLAQDERGGMKELQHATELLVKRVDQRDEDLAKKIEDCRHRYADAVHELHLLQEHELKLAAAQFKFSRDKNFSEAIKGIYSDKYDGGWWLMPLIRKCVATGDPTIGNLLELCKKISQEHDALSNHVFSDIVSESFTSDEIAAAVVERASRWTVRGLAVQAVGMLPGIGTSVAKRSADLNALVDTVQLDGRPIGAAELAKWKLVERRMQLDKNLDDLRSRWLELAENPMNNMPAHTKPSQHGREMATWVIDWMLPLMEFAGCIATNLQNNPGAMAQDRHAAFSTGRAQLETNRARALQEIVVAETQLKLKENMSQEALSSLQRFSQCLLRTGHARSSSIRSTRFEKEAKRALESCLPSLPCWIMPTWRVSQFLPAELASFDLVVLDEASQSDVLALPVLLRAKQMLVVGDERQVSPTEGFVSEDRIAELSALVPTSVSPFQGEMLPGRSIFDLASVMFPKHRVVLTEHFRCAPQIISYSNAQFYSGSLTPLRLPRDSERLEPALLDNPVEGVKVGKTNVVEADAIVDEIWRLSNDLQFCSRSIGVISLLGAEQARMIRRKLLERLGDLRFKRHVIMCGDPPTFQGAEYDIIFLSMVASPGSCPTQTGLMWSQRFNVAMSRARDRVYLFRSIKAADPSNAADLKVGLIQHFSSFQLGPSSNAVNPASRSSLAKLGAASQLMRRLRQDGFDVQAGGVECSGGLAMQLVVQGASDRRIGICIDGSSTVSVRNQDQWNALWKQSAERRQIMSRVGWKFWCCWETAFLLQPLVCYKELLDVLGKVGIRATRKPAGAATAPAPRVAGASAGAGCQAQASADVDTTDRSRQSAPGRTSPGRKHTAAARTARGQKRAADVDIEADEGGEPAAKQRRVVAADSSSASDAMLIEDDDAAAEAAGLLPASEQDSHAAVLGIGDGADQAAVRAAYRQRICDAASGRGDAGSDSSHSKQAIQSAFEALSAGAGSASAGASGESTAAEAADSGDEDDDDVYGLEDSLSDAGSDSSYKSDDGDGASSESDEDEDGSVAHADAAPARAAARARPQRRRRRRAPSGPPWLVGSVGRGTTADYPLPGVAI